LITNFGSDWWGSEDEWISKIKESGRGFDIEFK
jgi:hypothetical protein